MSNTQAPKLNESQKARATAIAATALQGFAHSFPAKHGREPTEAEAREFAGRVAESAIRSILKSDPAATAAKRASALKAVDELAKLHGVKFTHHRELEEVLVESQVVDTTETGYVEENLIDYVPATRGGTTLAFKYALDDQNNLFIEYAVAFCRADENFDPLIGKQEALKKFLAGEIIGTQITHEPFGPAKLDQLSSTYKAYEVAGKEAQPK